MSIVSLIYFVTVQLLTWFIILLFLDLGAVGWLSLHMDNFFPYSTASVLLFDKNHPPSPRFSHII